MFPNPEVLRTQSFWAFTGASWRRHDWLHYWPLAIELIRHRLSPAPRSGGGTETYNHMMGSPGNQPPSLGVVQKSTATQQKTPLTLSSQKIPREILTSEVCARSGDKGQVHIYYKSQYNNWAFHGIRSRVFLIWLHTPSSQHRHFAGRMEEYLKEEKENIPN